MIDLMLGFMKKPAALSALPSKEQSKILAEAVTNAKLKEDKPYMRYLYLVMATFILSSIFVGFYFESLKAGATYFVVTQWFFWYLIARKAKPIVYNEVPEEYR
ncbi:MAG: hypothetical protein HWE16_04990 [Gammaproteobacteria bacterium]|nr:hypothetical protein [Gammaproteobacteria bacterium]